MTAIIAGTSAVKATSTLIPFCHPLPVDSCKFLVDVVVRPHALGDRALQIRCTVACTARTGVEMEALTGASVAALTVYDMLKALSHRIVIAETKLVTKSGGKSDFVDNTAATATPAAANQQIEAASSSIATAAPASCSSAPSVSSEPGVRAPVPPFTLSSAMLKVRMAEDAWNSGDASRVALAYSADTRWRNRSEFLVGRPAAEAFLRTKWAREQNYRLIKELWAYTDNRIAVRFVYEWLDTSASAVPAAAASSSCSAASAAAASASSAAPPSSGQWMRSHGNENWLFDSSGLMVERHASINDVRIAPEQRLFHWTQGQPRPNNHPGLTELGL